MRILGAAALVAVLAAPAGAAWVVDGAGRCVREWTPASMGRGPTAMLEAPTAPFRTAAGVFTEMTPSPGAWGAPLAGLAFVGGLVDTVAWLGTGLADTLTGGYWEIAPREATALGLAPLRPPFARAPQTPPQDPCGRRLAS
ncbi:MAG TPA: hypothetical protein VKW76_16770 [Candidatus Binatia bacterium]|nr:hypothetical protein [Candidatus Binatia bacterium]